MTFFIGKVRRYDYVTEKLYILMQNIDSIKMSEVILELIFLTKKTEINSYGFKIERNRMIAIMIGEIV